MSHKINPTVVWFEILGQSLTALNWWKHPAGKLNTSDAIDEKTWYCEVGGGV